VAGAMAAASTLACRRREPTFGLQVCGDEERRYPHPAAGADPRRQHCLEHLAPPGQPSLCHPFRELDHPRGEQRLLILDADHALERCLRKIARADGHAIGETLTIATAERHPHPPPWLDVGRQRFRHEIIERLIDALRQDDRGHDALPGVVFHPLRPTREELPLVRMLVRRVWHARQ